MANNSAPSGRFVAVTPHASNDIPYINEEPCRALFIGVAGNVVVVGEDNVPVTFKGLAAGQVLPVRARRVNATNTTATDIVALY